MVDFPSDDELTPIENALFEGRKIEAIKLYRNATGAHLVDAKDAVEAIERDLRARSPERFVARASSRSGCAGVIVFAGLASTALGWAAASL